LYNLYTISKKESSDLLPMAPLLYKVLQWLYNTKNNANHMLDMAIQSSSNYNNRQLLMSYGSFIELLQVTLQLAPYKICISLEKNVKKP
jgi:hypothetical protein